MSNWRSGTVAFKGIGLHFLEAGKGPAVLLLHGFLGSAGMWKTFAEPLTKNFRVIAPDLPGHGQTPNLGYVHTMEEMAEAVQAICVYLRLKRLTVIGHSMGGYVALAFAEKWPDRIRGLGLFHSTSRADSDEKKKDRDRAIRVAKQSPAAYVRAAVPGLFRPVSLTRYRKEVTAYKQQALQMPVQGIVAALEGMKIRQDREPLLHFSPYPVLMITGLKDPVLPPEKMEEQLQAPRVITRYASPHGHMGFIEDRENCLKAIQSFLKVIK